jgi:hypothetical protein
MTLRERIIEVITIKSASRAQTARGEQWQITADIPSMHSHNAIGPIWKPYEEGETIQNETQVRVELVRGSPRKNSAYLDRDYGHFWELTPDGWNTTKELTPLPSTPTPSTNGGGGSDQIEYRRSKELMNWIEALKIAARLYGKEHTEVHIDYARIRSIALTIYAEITTGPPQTEAEPAYPDATEMGSDAPEMAVEVLVASEPQTTTAPPTTPLQRVSPKSSPGKLNELKETMKAMGCERDDVIKYCCDNFDERGPDDLVDAEVDRLTEAVLAGQITGAW